MKCILSAILFYAMVLAGAEPIAVYTLLEDPPDERMAVQWVVSEEKPSDDSLYYRELGSTQWAESTASVKPLAGLPNTFVYRAVMTGLRAETAYEFKLKRSDRSYKARSLPKGLSRPLSFVAGGDIYHDTIDYVQKMNRVCAHLNPDFVLLGGDIAYTGSKFAIWSDTIDLWTQKFFANFKIKVNKQERWIDWLRAWSDNMIDAQGRKIPLFATIGNHDVNGRAHQTPAEAKAFYTLFVGESPTVYRKVDFGNDLLVVALDSGHTAPVEGTQTSWLYNTLKDRKEVLRKFVFYHTPAFPSCRAFHYKQGAAVRRHWVPFFEMFGVDAVFEHHDHAYKRTVPIRQGKEAPNGVLYFGDGAWGVHKLRRPRRGRWYMAHTAQSRNIIFVEVKKDSVIFTAYDDEGKVLDQAKTLIDTL